MSWLELLRNPAVKTIADICLTVFVFAALAFAWGYIETETKLRRRDDRDPKP